MTTITTTTVSGTASNTLISLLRVIDGAATVLNATTTSVGQAVDTVATQIDNYHASVIAGREEVKTNMVEAKLARIEVEHAIVMLNLSEQLSLNPKLLAKMEEIRANRAKAKETAAKQPSLTLAS